MRLGSALEWFRVEVCAKEGHNHGEAGEMDCLLQRAALARSPPVACDVSDLAVRPGRRPKPLEFRAPEHIPEGTRPVPDSREGAR